MVKFHPQKNSFTSGELTPRMDGRDDTKQYDNGMRQAQNGYILPHGGFMKRSGARYVANVKTDSLKTRLLPFLFSTTQAYIIEFGNLYARFFTLETQLVDGVPLPVEVVTPYLTAELEELQFAQSDDVMFIVHPNHPTYELTRTSALSFSMTEIDYRLGHAPMRALNLDTTFTITVTTGPVTLTGSSAIWATNGDDVGRWVRVEKGGDEAWYKIDSVSSSTVALATKKGGTNPTGAADNWATGMTSDTEGFRAATFHEGRLGFGGARLTDVDRWWLSQSDDFENFDLGTGLANEAISRRLTGGQVNEVRWMATAAEILIIGSSGGEYRVVGDNQDLLTPAGTKVGRTTSRGGQRLQPVVIDADVLFMQRDKRTLRGFNFNFQEGTAASRPLTLLAEHILDQGDGVGQMAYQQSPDSIVWLQRNDGQIVGLTIEKEQAVLGAGRHIMAGSFQGGDPVVESVAVIPNPNEKEDQVWIIVKKTVDGSTVRQVMFFEEQFRPECSDSEAQEDQLFLDAGLTLDNPTDVCGITNANPPVVTTCAPHGFTTGKIVRLRDVVGVLDDCGESMVNHFSCAIVVLTSTTFELRDCMDTTNATPFITGGTAREEVTTILGLEHLEGEEVCVMGDGGQQADKTVASGSITIESASIVHVGQCFTYQGETERFVGGGRLGSDAGAQTRIGRVRFLLHNTSTGEFGIGPNPGQTESYLARAAGDRMDRFPPLFCGWWETPLESSWTTEPTVFFRDISPHPITVLAVVALVESGGE